MDAQHVADPITLQHFRHAVESRRRSRVFLTSGLLVLSLPVALATMAITVALYARGIGRDAPQAHPQATGAFCVLAVTPPAWVLVIMTLLPTDRLLVRAVADVVVTALAVSIVAMSILMSTLAQGKFHYRELTCQDSAPHYCWYLLSVYAGWAVLFTLMLAWTLWIHRTSPGKPLLYSPSYYRIALCSMMEYRKKHGNARLARLFLFGGFPGMCPSFWVEYSVPSESPNDIHVNSYRSVNGSMWLSIRLFGVLAGLHMAQNGIVAYHIWGVDDLDMKAFFAFAASCALFMGVFPSRSNRQRTWAFLARFEQTAEERKAAAVAALFASTRADTAYEYAMRTFWVVDGSELKADDFAGEQALRIHVDSLDGASGRSRAQVRKRTRLADLGKCDAFCSHSWRDDASAQWIAIKEWVSAFQSASGRTPTLWIDMLSLDDQNINQSLTVLPIYLSGCETLLALYGPTFQSRLWCIMELCA